MIGHLWYLSEECAAFSIYEDRINNDVRRKMTHILLKECIPSQSVNEMEIEQQFEEKINKLVVKEDDLEHFLKKSSLEFNHLKIAEYISEIPSFKRIPTC